MLLWEVMLLLILLLGLVVSWNHHGVRHEHPVTSTEMLAVLGMVWEGWAAENNVTTDRRLSYDAMGEMAMSRDGGRGG